MPEPGCWTTLLSTYLPTILVAAFIAWLTATLALPRDKAAWAKESEQRTLQDSMDRAGEIIEWAHRGASPPYPYLPFMYLQLHLAALGAGALRNDLKQIRIKAAQLYGPSPDLTGESFEYDRRAFIGDVIFLGIKLQRHVRKSVGLRVYPAPTRQEIDA